MRIIVNSVALLKALALPLEPSYLMSVEHNLIKIMNVENQIIGICGCHHKDDFTCTLFQVGRCKLITFLREIEEQPVTIEFKDSERFNVIIKEAIL